MKIRNMLLVFSLVFIGTLFCACSADYGTFGESKYKSLKDIRFEEQDGNSSFYHDEHKIKVNLQTPPKKKSTWDSVTVESFDISNMASLHLVDGKFKEFPSDSVSLDSLAEKISYKSSRIYPGDKIRLPKNHFFYVVVVAENGDASIWQLEFTIPGVEPTSSISKDENDGNSSSSEKIESLKSSSSSNRGDSQNDDSKDDKSNNNDSKNDELVAKSSSSVVLSANNDLQVNFKNEISNKISGDTIYVIFAQGTKLSEISVDTVIFHRNASIDKDPKKVKEWSNNQNFVVSAENGSSKKWTIIVQVVKNTASDLQIAFEKQLKVNRSGDTIAIKLVNDASMDDIKLSSFSISNGATINPLPNEIKKWTESQKFVVIAEDGSKKSWVVTIAIAEMDEKASDEKELLSIAATGEVSAADIDKLKKTVVFHLPSKESLGSVSITIEVSKFASHNLESSPLNLMAPKTIIITAEDGSSVEWTISADYTKSSAAEIFSFEVDKIPVSNMKIDKEKRTISFMVPYGTDLSNVFFNLKLSEGAKKTSPKNDYIDLSSKKGKIVVSAEDETTLEWILNVEEDDPPLPANDPRILGLKIDGQSAIIDSVKENGTFIYWVHYDNLTFLADLTQLLVSDIQLPEDCFITGVVDGSRYDLSYGIKATVYNTDGKSLDYEIRAGYQYPNNDMEEWSKDDKKPISWDNGNQTSGAIKMYMTESYNTSLSGTAVKMTSAEVIGKFASGNLFIGDFNPNNEGQLIMLSYKDGNELIDFGKPFKARPRFMEVDFKYDGKNSDSCDIYIILENRTSTSDNGSNLKRTSNDVNTLVASAWYRAKTDSSFTNPDVVSISKKNADGLRTLRLALKYGEPHSNSPIMNIGSGKGKVSVLSTDGLQNKNGIDNHLIKGDGSNPVTHIRIVAASSADGNHYVGNKDATLIVDNFKFIY